MEVDIGLHPNRERALLRQLDHHLHHIHVCLLANSARIETSRLDEWCNGRDAPLELATGECGCPQDVLPRIFDPFFTTKEDQNRTGLGLAVAAGIIEQHAGEITVRSQPGEGTEFRVALPATAAAGVGGRH